MTRVTIRNRVSYYLDRSDLNTLIQYWIDDTRVDLALKANFHYLYTEACASTVANSSTYALPDDYLGHETIWCGSKKLARMTGREFDELTPTDADATAVTRRLPTESAVTSTSILGYPDYYVHRGMNIELYPTPDAVYTIRVKYYAQPAAFDDDDDYDYITTFHPEAVIWGTALRGAVYLDDDTKVQKFESAYGNAVQEMMKREKDFELEDQHPRMKSWKDFDPMTFKRLIRMKI